MKSEGQRIFGKRTIICVDLLWILGTFVGNVWPNIMWFRLGANGGCYERCNEFSVSKKCGELVDWLIK